MSQQPFSNPSSLNSLLAKARSGGLVVAALYSSDNCPWCVALKNEQLAPRVRATTRPALQVIELDADSRAAFTLPDRRRLTSRQWASEYGFRVMPTLAMLNEHGQPLGEALIGYGSPDFYSAYLEERIKTAHLYWQNITS